MARILKLSRARFYQLIDNGVFPPPAYCCSSRKPVYPKRLQEVCLNIRKTGIGFSGQFIRFYEQRKPPRHKNEHKQIRQILHGMGLSVSVHQVKEALGMLGLRVASEDSINTDCIRKLFEYFYAGRQKGV